MAGEIERVVFLVARLGVMDQFRPRYLSPLKLTWDPLEPSPLVGLRPFFGTGDWVISRGPNAPTGHDLSSGPIRADSAIGACMRAAPDKSGEAVNRCLHDNGFVHTVFYHPADRFWAFQAIETALFLGVAALLGLTYWWVTRRVV